MGKGESNDYLIFVIDILKKKTKDTLTMQDKWNLARYYMFDSDDAGEATDNQVALWLDGMINGDMTLSGLVEFFVEAIGGTCEIDPIWDYWKKRESEATPKKKKEKCSLWQKKHIVIEPEARLEGVACWIMFDCFPKDLDPEYCKFGGRKMRKV